MSYRRRRRKIESGSSASADSRQMMTLALFIMLLAFFIVLNTLSSYEEIKTEQARRSVQLAFSNDPELQERKTSVKPDPAKSMMEGHTFDRIDALFESQIASFESTQSKSQGVMMVRVPYDKFSQAVMAVGQKDLTRYPSRRAVQGNFFLPTLVSIMRANIDGAPTRLEMLIHTDENPAQLQNQSPVELGKEITKVGEFSRKLAEQGMPKKLINIGISDGNPDYVDLVFRKYVPFSPVQEGVE